MSIAPRKEVTFKINGQEVKAPEGIPILDAAQRLGFTITNLCYNRKLKPFAACRTCMVDMRVDGRKSLVYSCTQPVAEGIEVQINTEETNRYNNACLEMLLVEHPLDCPTCDKSGVCPLQDNTEEMGIYNARFEVNRRNEPSIKSNPIIEFYLNRCIMCGMCVRVCDETQGVQALDFFKRGFKVGIGTANDEPLDCEFCGQCITVCPTGALMDMTSKSRGLAALFKSTQSVCSFCSWGCTVKLDAKKGKLIRIEADDRPGVGINDGNLCAKGRFGHGFVQHPERLRAPMINVGGSFQEISWREAIAAVAERLQAAVNRSGAASVAGIGSEKLANEENYLFQKIFRGILGSNQVTTLQNLRAPYVNQFMLQCFANGIVSQPVTELEHADVALIFNSDLPSEFPVAGNAIRKGAVFNRTEIILANPRKVVFKNEARENVRLQYALGADLVVANRLSRIIIDNNLVDVGKARAAIAGFDAWTQSLAGCTAEYAAQRTGIGNDVFTRAAERFARPADRFVLCGNDVLETGQGEEILRALLNLATLVRWGGQGRISIFPPREHCNSQGAADMGLTPEFLPGYRSAADPGAVAALAKEWGVEAPKFGAENPAAQLFESCQNGAVKALYIVGEDPARSYHKGAQALDALRTVPFLVVQDLYMTETAKQADIILPACSYAEKDGTFTNMTRHVQRIAPAVLPEGSAKPDFDIFMELAAALGKPFAAASVAETQEEIARAAPIYKGMFPGGEAKQWQPDDSFSVKPAVQPGQEAAADSGKAGYPFKLLTGNHMFHNGSYSQYAPALAAVGPECVAQLHRDDAKALGVSTGDKVAVESACHKLELPVEVDTVTARGMVYVPKNWPLQPVNLLRNGEEGFVSVKVTKAG